MIENMDAILTREGKREVGTDLLLRHCLAVGRAENRIPARVRLEREIGPELARRLVASLVAHSRR